MVGANTRTYARVMMAAGSAVAAKGKGRKPDLARVLAGAGGLWVMVAS